ncbi:Alpha/Beta hydrolase protein [Chytriomyces sp. MP71]|nr:Alpha/Beta hydrolase protein [Chytriomyces sp. MP71]
MAIWRAVFGETLAGLQLSSCHLRTRRGLRLPRPSPLCSPPSLALVPPSSPSPAHGVFQRGASEEGRGEKKEPPVHTPRMTATHLGTAERSVAIGTDTFRVWEWGLSPESPGTAAPVPPAKGCPLFVLHHGAGSSALTFAFAASRLAALVSGEPGLRHSGACVVAIDARGHGATTCANEELELGALANDLVNVVEAVRRDSEQEIVLVGHSMGGSVVVEACNSGRIKNVVGVAVIDVVEGTAIESLAHMNRILKEKPSQFRKIEDAIKWTMRSRLVQNKESAEVSVPPLLIQKADPPVYVWRTNLAASEPYWRGWFEGLSQKFLSMKTGRLLILAGADRLDKELMIGQMQGKFQVVVYPESWHYVQEDVPAKLAESLIDFWRRNQRLAIIKRFPIPIKSPAAASPSTGALPQ